MTRNTNLNRRHFLRLSTGAGVVALAAACTPAAAPTAAPPAAQGGTTPAAKPAVAPTPAAKSAAAPTAATKPPAAPTAAAKAPAVKAPLTKVMVITTGGLVDNAHWMVGLQKGFFEEFGIDFQNTGLAGGKTQLDALLGDAGDVVDISPSAPLAAIEQGAPFKVLSGSRLLLSYAFFAQKHINTLKDLEGQVVGSGPANAFNQNLTRALFRKVGVDSNKVEFANIGTSANIYQALTAGKVVAGISGVTYVASAERDGLKVLAELWKELPDYVTWSFLSSDRAIKEKGDALVRLLAGFAKTYRYTKTPEAKDHFLKIAVEELAARPEDAETYWNFSRNEGALAANLELTPRHLEYMQQLNITDGIQTKVLPLEQVADFSIRDKALALLKG